MQKLSAALIIAALCAPSIPTAVLAHLAVSMLTDAMPVRDLITAIVLKLQPPAQPPGQGATAITPGASRMRAMLIAPGVEETALSMSEAQFVLSA